MRYLAYGSNMDPVQMAKRCPDAVALGAARLPGYRLTFTFDSIRWSGGVGHVEPSPEDEVWGVLWEISPADEASLDRYESVAEGWYRKETVRVEHDGATVEAMTYMANARGYKPPSARYLRAVLRGARAHGLPPAYLARLRALASGAEAAR